jgi:hypothetical protein
MIKRTFLAAAVLFLFMNTVYAEIKIFLHPRSVAASNLILGDIASIEADQLISDNIKNITIEQSLYSDGYIDKKEIALLLKQYTNDNFSIYGNAVRVTNDLQDDLYNTADQYDPAVILLRKGDRVNIIIKRNGISLMLKGTAIDDGKINDEIAVKLDNKAGALHRATVKGRIKSKDRVEIDI